MKGFVTLVVLSLAGLITSWVGLTLVAVRAGFAGNWGTVVAAAAAVFMLGTVAVWVVRREVGWGKVGG